MRKYRKGRGAKAISDRSGFPFPMEEMVIEPGTGWLVHYTESDGEYNLVDHPANHVNEYVDYGDPFPIEYARPERTFELFRVSAALTSNASFATNSSLSTLNSTASLSVNPLNISASVVVTLTGTALLTAESGTSVRGEALLVGSANLSSSPFFAVLGSASLEGSAGLTGSGSFSVPSGSIQLTSEASSMFSGRFATQGSSGMAGEGSLVSSVTKLSPGVSSISGTASISAEGTLVEPLFFDVVNGTVTLEGTASVPSLSGSAHFGLTFNDDGTKLYISDASSVLLRQYSVATAFDVTSGLTADGSFSPSSAFVQVAFNTDGTKLYGFTGGNNIRQYSVTTAFDITGTVTLDTTFTTPTPNNGTLGFSFSADGSTLFIHDGQDDIVYQYILDTPFDLSGTVTADGVSSSTSDTSETYLLTSADGSKVYTQRTSSGSFSRINQYALSTPFDVTDTFTFEGSYTFSEYVTGNLFPAWNNNGSRLYAFSPNFQEIHQYSVT